MPRKSLIKTTVIVNKMLSYRRETALQCGLGL